MPRDGTTAPKPGRPKGVAKTGGRKKGTPNKRTTMQREYIAKAADPIGFLVKMVLGEPIKRKGGEVVEEKPTLTDMKWAAQILANKTVPDLKSVDQHVEAELNQTLNDPHNLSNMSDAQKLDRARQLHAELFGGALGLNGHELTVGESISPRKEEDDGKQDDGGN